MRVLFCGSGRFGIASLKAILAGKNQVVGIITAPARPAGRGGKLRPTALANAAAQLGLTITETEDINSPSSLAEIQRLAPDIICVVDFGQFVSSAVCRAARLGAFNLHGSLLPELRGAAPVNWAIIRGHSHTGVTTFSLAPHMDTGAIYGTRPTEVSPEETAEDLHARLAEIGAGLVASTLDMLAAGPTEPQEQDDSKATLAPKLRKSDGVIDFSADAVTVRNLIHGTWPWPGGQAVFAPANGRKQTPVIIARAACEAAQAAGAPGTLDADLVVATGDGGLRIIQIKPAGKRLMHWRDFVNGYRVTEGDRFITPSS